MTAKASRDGTSQAGFAEFTSEAWRAAVEATLQRWLQQGRADEKRPATPSNLRRALEVLGRIDKAAPALRPAKPSQAVWRSAPKPPPPTPLYAGELHRVEREILRCAESPEYSPLEAIRHIERICNWLENARGLAEARVRLLLHRTRPPDLADAPIWLKDELAELGRTEEEQPLHAVLGNVELLVRAALAQNSFAVARVKPSARGGAEVLWQSELRLRWLVLPSSIKWPGIFVRRYRAMTTEDTKLDAESFLTAHSLVADFAESMRSAAAGSSD